MTRKKNLQPNYMERPDEAVGAANPISVDEMLPLKDTVRPGELIPAAIYVRVSSSGQDVENSTDAQINECRVWAARHGYIIVKVFVDKAKTGTVAGRPDFQEMVTETESPDCPFEVVLVWRFSRFFRDYVQSVVYEDRLLKNGVKITSVNEPNDDTAMGRLIRFILSAINGYQSELIGEDVRMGTHNLAARGFFLGRVAPHGMIKIKVQDGEKIRNKLAPDPKTAPSVRRAFDLALQDMTERPITRQLKKEGILGPNGKPWPANRIHDALTNRHYEGTIVWGRNLDGTPKTVCEGAHEGIVEPWEFAKVQEQLKSRDPEVVNPAAAGSKKFLSRLGKCRQCGSNYNYTPAGRDGKNYSYIVCQKRKDFGTGPEGCDSPYLPADEFEALTLDVIEEDILSMPKLEVAIEELRKDSGTLHNQGQSLADDLRGRIDDLDQRLTRLYFAYENGDIEYERYSSRNQELRSLKERVQANLEAATEGVDDTTIILNDPDAVLAYAEDLKSFLKDESPVRARAWLKTFLRRYWVEPGYVTYEYSIPLPPDSKRPGMTKRRVPLDEVFRPTARSGPRKRE